MISTPSRREWELNYKVGVGMYHLILDHVLGFSKKYESDNAFKELVVPCNQIVNVDRLCWALGASWVTDGFSCSIYARRTSLELLKTILDSKRRIWGRLVERGFLSEATIDVSPAQATLLSKAQQRITDPIRAAHFVAEHHHGARDFDTPTAAEIVLRTKWDNFSGGGVAFGTFSS